MQCDLPIQNPVHMQINKAGLAKKIEEVRKLKMLNDQVARILLPGEEVKSRIGAAGALLRTGVNGARPALHQIGGLIDEPAKLKLGEKKRIARSPRNWRVGGTIRGLSPGMKTGRSSYCAPLVVLDEVDKMCDLAMFTVAKSRTTAYRSDACVIAV